MLRNLVTMRIATWKPVLSLVLGIIVSVSQSAQASQSPRINLVLNQKALVSKVAPVVVKGRTLVPVRVIAESLGANVNWLPELRAVSIVKGDITMMFYIDTPIMQVCGYEESLEVAPMIIKGRTMLPLRAIAEPFGLSVKWKGKTKTVILQGGTND